MEEQQDNMPTAGKYLLKMLPVVVLCVIIGIFCYIRFGS
jgi:hypothetical protein